MRRYTFPGLGEYQEPAEELMRSKQPVVLYGFNQSGRKVFRVLRKKQIPVVAILDLYQVNILKEYDGVPVISPESFDGYDKDYLYLICSNRYFDEMKENLQRHGCFRILPYYAVYCNETFTYDEMVYDGNTGDGFLPLCQIAQRAGDNRKIRGMGLQDACVIDSIDVVITEKCSLRCKNCCNLMQYFERPRHAEMDKVLMAMERLLASVDYIYEIRLIGGEPFVNREWHHYIRAFLKYENFGCVIVYTNGTVLPDREQTEILRNPRVFTRVSDYGIASQKTDQLIQILREQECFYSVEKVTEWTDCGQIVSGEHSVAELTKQYRECCMSGCLSLKDEKIFLCPFAGNLYALKAIPEEESDYIDLSVPVERETLRKRITDIPEKQFIRACGYCMGRPMGSATIPAAEQCGRPPAYQRKEGAGHEP